MVFSAYIRKIEDGLAFTTHLVAPWPLNRLDRWLLLNHPWLWRTGSVPMVGIAAWLAAGCYALGLFTPISPQTMPTITDVSTVWSIILVIGLIVLGLWLASQIRWPLPNMSIHQMLSTWLVYALIIFCIATSPAAYSIPVTARMARSVPDDVFAAEYAFHDAHDFWVCTTALDETLAHDERHELLASLKRFGFRPTFSYVPDGLYRTSDGSLELFCPDGKPTFIFRLADTFGLRLPSTDATTSSFLFGERLQAVYAAKLAIYNHSGLLGSITTGSVIPSVIYSFSASLCVLLFCPLSRVSIGARFLSATWSALLELRPRRRLPLLRLFSFQPSHHPTLYALSPMKIFLSHVALAALFLLTIFLGLLGNTPDDAVDRLSSRLTYFLASVVGLATPIVICGLNVHLSRQTLDGIERILAPQLLIYGTSTIPAMVVLMTISCFFGFGDYNNSFIAMIGLLLFGSYVAMIILAGFLMIRWIAPFVMILAIIGFVVLVITLGTMVAIPTREAINDDAGVLAAFLATVAASIAINRLLASRTKILKYLLYSLESVALFCVFWIRLAVMHLVGGIGGLAEDLVALFSFWLYVPIAAWIMRNQSMKMLRLIKQPNPY